LAVTAFLASTIPLAAQDFPETSNLSASDGLAYACQGNEGKLPLCIAYIIGAIDGTINGQVLEALERGDLKISPSLCPPAELSYGSIVQLFMTFPKGAHRR
jgi:hypothetical protein